MVYRVLSESILAKAMNKGIVKYHVKNLFDYADLPHKRIDDYPFGGGTGMILKPEPIFKAYNEVLEEIFSDSKAKVIFPSPDGSVFNHNKAVELLKADTFIFINGHYKGVDQRIRDELVTDEISIGDYVLTGGELASLVITDSIVRLIPDVLNSYESAETDSFYHSLLDCPHYTRPEIFKGLSVPKILLSGNHKKIDEWKNKERETKTRNRRPDLWEKYKK